jgi:sodium-dependent dicarboxylate transporter 2/3/5
VNGALRRFPGLTGVVAAVGAALLVLLLPRPEAIPAGAQRLAALFLLCLVLWTTEAIPLAATSLLALALQPIFGVAPLGAALTSFISPVFFFVIAMFCLAQAFTTSGLSRRFALALLARAGTDPRRVLFALMAGTAVSSTVISDVPCTAIFMAIALPLFDKMGLEPGRSNFAKAVMMGIPIAAFIGGIGTPAGSAINVLGLTFLEEYGKVRVPFLSWMAIGMPMVVILTPIAWWSVLRFFPPEMATVAGADELAEERAALGPIRATEVKVLTVFGAMFTCWILSTWVRQLDVALVAILGAVALFLPGMKVFGWKEVERATGWDVLLVIGAVTSLGAASVKTGLAKAVVDLSLGGLGAGSTFSIVAAIAAFTVVIHLVLTIGPVIVAVVVPPIVLLATANGHNPALFALPVVFTASCAFLLPLDAVMLVTYAKGYYRMVDLFRPGLVISLAWIVLMAGLMTLLGPRLGFFS